MHMRSGPFLSWNNKLDNMKNTFKMALEEENRDFCPIMCLSNRLQYCLNLTARDF